MTKIQNPKPVCELEKRTIQFAKAVRPFVKTSQKQLQIMRKVNDL